MKWRGYPLYCLCGFLPVLVRRAHFVSRISLVGIFSSAVGKDGSFVGVVRRGGRQIIDCSSGERVNRMQWHRYYPPLYPPTNILAWQRNTSSPRSSEFTSGGRGYNLLPSLLLFYRRFSTLFLYCAYVLQSPLSSLLVPRRREQIPLPTLCAML
jgi:hypothetical protein